MATVLDFITDAYQESGLIAIGEAPTAAEAQKGLTKLNDMLDSWALDSLLVYSTVPEVFDLVGGQSIYTMGVGGNFNVERPISIVSAYLRSVNNIDTPLMVTDQSQVYADITDKTILSTMPQALYDDGGYPLKNLYLYPVPSDSSYKLVLWVWKSVTQFTSLNQNVFVPTGYTSAIKYNLAVLLCSAFGVEPSPVLVDAATRSKVAVERHNIKVDPLIPATATLTSGAAYNFITDTIVKP